VGLLDILRGQRPPRRADIDRLFAVSTAEPTLVAQLDLTPTLRAGVCFKPVQMATFADLMRDLDELLAISGTSTGTRVRRETDDFGFQWIVLEDDDSLGDLVTTVHLVNRTIAEQGFGGQLLCSVFGFRSASGPVHLVYGYARGTFYPFVPLDATTRDNAAELRLSAALGREMPMEPDTERWYPVWGAPISDGAGGA
jgi:hypothetical protein